MKFEKPHKHEPTEPQLATMIDVFSILIIFLIAGTTLDSSILVVPNDIILPSTVSEATIINSPQVTINQDNIWLSINNKEYKISSLDSFEENQKNQNEEIKNTIKKYFDNLKKNNEKVSTIKINNQTQYLNLVADKSTPYNKVFKVIKYFNQNGFNSVVLVGTIINNNGKDK